MAAAPRRVAECASLAHRGAARAAVMSPPDTLPVVHAAAVGIPRSNTTKIAAAVLWSAARTTTGKN